ncbi:MAG: NAD-dependent deacylase [Anaerolineales bacterium]|nr:NAD-dependent deacylase [Anaerolineales bacterium]
MTIKSSRNSQYIIQAAKLIKEARQTVVLTGAGISTGSGIPDFRSEGSGLWSTYDPFEVASLSAFRYHPERFFQWMRPLATGILAAKPNNAHQALARLQQAGLIHLIITQNIDGLHHKAYPSNILEVHGTLRTLTCVGCFKQINSTMYLEPYIEHGEIPRCPTCGNILKPDVVLFEEQLPIQVWMQAQEACSKCDLMIVGGSSLEVMPVAGLPMRAVENEAHLIIINNTPTYIDPRAEVVIHHNITDVLPAIVDELI